MAVVGALTLGSTSFLPVAVAEAAEVPVAASPPATSAPVTTAPTEGPAPIATAPPTTATVAAGDLGDSIPQTPVDHTDYGTLGAGLYADPGGVETGDTDGSPVGGSVSVEGSEPEDWELDLTLGDDEPAATSDDTDDFGELIWFEDDAEPVVSSEAPATFNVVVFEPVGDPTTGASDAAAIAEPAETTADDDASAPTTTPEVLIFGDAIPVSPSAIDAALIGAIDDPELIVPSATPVTCGSATGQSQGCQKFEVSLKGVSCSATDCTILGSVFLDTKLTSSDCKGWFSAKDCWMQMTPELPSTLKSIDWTPCPSPWAKFTLSKQGCKTADNAEGTFNFTAVTKAITGTVTLQPLFKQDRASKYQFLTDSPLAVVLNTFHIAASGPAYATAGTPFNYIVNLDDNPDSGSLSDVKVTFGLKPAPGDYVDGTSSIVSTTSDAGWSCFGAGVAISLGCNFALTLPDGAHATFNIAVTAKDIVDQTEDDYGITATATCTLCTASTSTWEGTTIRKQDTTQLSITKDGPTGVIAGQSITYEIHVSNVGDHAATSVSVQDILPVGNVIQNASITVPAGWTCDQSTLMCTISSLASGGVAHFTVTGTVKADQAVGATLIDSAVANAANLSISEEAHGDIDRLHTTVTGSSSAAGGAGNVPGSDSGVGSSSASATGGSASASGSGTGDELAFTGSSAASFGLFGLLILGLGAAFAIAGRGRGRRTIRVD